MQGIVGWLGAGTRAGRISAAVQAIREWSDPNRGFICLDQSAHQHRGGAPSGTKRMVNHPFGAVHYVMRQRRREFDDAFRRGSPEDVSYVDIDIFGVYVAPIVPMMLLALAVTLVLRWAAVAVGLFRWIWHPALFEFSVYLIVLTAVVLVAGSLKIHI